jgi:hypothetical protein
MTSSPPAWGMGTGKRSGQPRNDKDYSNIGPGSYAVHLKDKRT